MRKRWKLGSVERGFQGFRWTSGSEGGTHFEPSATPEALRGDLEAYIHERTPQLPASNLAPERLEMLRALGYLAPEPSRDVRQDPD